VHLVEAVEYDRVRPLRPAEHADEVHGPESWLK
jgi:hypothetical protein